MEHLNLVDMAETTHEMWSCHERAFSSAKQQSLSPHPMLRNCQGGSIPLPQIYDALFVVQKRQKGGAAEAIGFLLVGFRGRRSKALHLPGSLAALLL